MKRPFRFPKLPIDGSDVLVFVGASGMFIGIWQIYHPAAYIIGGAGCIYLALLGAKPPKGSR